VSIKKVVFKALTLSFQSS